MATLFPPATLSVLQLPVGGLVDVLVPGILDGSIISSKKSDAYSETASGLYLGPGVALKDVFDAVSSYGGVAQPQAIGGSPDYRYRLHVALPRFGV